MPRRSEGEPAGTHAPEDAAIDLDEEEEVVEVPGAAENDWDIILKRGDQIYLFEDEEDDTDDPVLLKYTITNIRNTGSTFWARPVPDDGTTVEYLTREEACAARGRFMTKHPEPPKVPEPKKSRKGTGGASTSTQDPPAAGSSKESSKLVVLRIALESAAVGGQVSMTDIKVSAAISPTKLLALFLELDSTSGRALNRELLKAFNAPLYTDKADQVVILKSVNTVRLVVPRAGKETAATKQGHAIFTTITERGILLDILDSGDEKKRQIGLLIGFEKSQDEIPDSTPLDALFPSIKVPWRRPSRSAASAHDHIGRQPPRRPDASPDMSGDDMVFIPPSQAPVHRLMKAKP